MRLILLTPGAGGMFCGNCLRDNALARALRAAGHDAFLVPLYTPLTLDSPSAGGERIFFGGINVFLQQHFGLFRRSPEILDRALDSPWLLNGLLRFAVNVNPAGLGRLTLSMLQGEGGRQRKELEKLAAWLKTQRPDAVVLSNGLLLGLARRLKDVLGVPILCTLNGEDTFLDRLPAASKAEVLAAIRQRLGDVKAFLPVSAYYFQRAQDYLGIPAGQLRLVRSGIDLIRVPPAVERPPQPPAIGYLARIAPEKGLLTLVAAFAQLRRDSRFAQVTLRVAGRAGRAEQAYLRAVKNAIGAAGLSAHVSFVDCADEAAKFAFLRTLTVFSAPTVEAEAFGLNALEALACGAPVVLPEHGAFREIVEATGGGILVRANDSAALAAGLAEVLSAGRNHPLRNTSFREAVQHHFSAQRMAAELVNVCEQLRGRTV